MRACDGGLMRFRLPHASGVAAACVLAAPAAHAFTVENKDAAGQYAVPKFDLEEQAKNFRKDDGTDASGRRTPSTASCSSTPLGQASVRSGSAQRGSQLRRQDFGSPARATSGAWRDG